MQNDSADYLKKALVLAQQKRGFCAPNPSVGAVIVKNDQIIAEGYHSGTGKMHAEAIALQALSTEEANGSVVYVTLEPCCHQGRTPPCTDLLIRSGIKAVYYGFVDPNPLVAGKGIEQLQAAGIQCIHVSLPEINLFYRSYSHWICTHRPWVTAKLAMSLDGKIAGVGGKNMAITGETAQIFTHQLRKESDAILTTVKATLRDDPQLNIRPPVGNFSKPIYVLDTRLEFPMEARLLKTAEKIVLFHAESAEVSRKKSLEAQGIICVPMGLKGGLLDSEEILDYMGQAGIHDLLIEAGGICFESWVLRRHVQRGFIYVALKWIGNDAQSAFTEKTSIFGMAHSLQWHVLGEDAACEFLL